MHTNSVAMRIPAALLLVMAVWFMTGSRQATAAPLPEMPSAPAVRGHPDHSRLFTSARTLNIGRRPEFR